MQFAINYDESKLMIRKHLFSFLKQNSYIKGYVHKRDDTYSMYLYHIPVFSLKIKNIKKNLHIFFLLILLSDRENTGKYIDTDM